MAASKIELQVKQIIARLTRTSVDGIDTTRKVTDYGIDSLGQLEFREIIERKFQTYLDDRTFTSFSSIDELVSHVSLRQEPQLAKSGDPVSETLAHDPNGSSTNARQSRLNASGVLFEDVEIGMSLTCLNNLAESPLLKYLGDLRWRHLSALTGVPSKLFVDDNGQRLYPSFFFVEMSFPQNNPLAAYGENDVLKIASTLKRFGSSMLDGLSFLLPAGYSETGELPFAGLDEAVAAGVPAVRLSNIFVEQHNGAGWLRTARPSNPGFKAISELAQAPESYLRMKQVENGGYLSRPPKSYQLMTGSPVRIEYPLVIDRDFSSTGLVYFANYPMFLDICEREVLGSARLLLPQEMIDMRTIVRRQSAYLNNATPNETLVVEIEPWVENPFCTNDLAPELAPVRLFVNYRMHRKSDMRLMMVSTAEKMIFGMSCQDLPFFSQLASEGK